MDIRTTNGTGFKTRYELIRAIEEATGLSWKYREIDRYSGELELGNHLATTFITQDTRDGRWYVSSVVGLSQSGEIAIHNLSGCFGSGAPFECVDSGERIPRYVLKPKV